MGVDWKEHVTELTEEEAKLLTKAGMDNIGSCHKDSIMYTEYTVQNLVDFIYTRKHLFTAEIHLFSSNSFFFMYDIDKLKQLV